jgi:hypothetical protein
MVSVNLDNMVSAMGEAEGDARPIDGQKLLMGLRQQLDLADQLGLDLVAIRITETLDQLVADLGQSSLATAPNYRH